MKEDRHRITLYTLKEDRHRITLYNFKEDRHRITLYTLKEDRHSITLCFKDQGNRTVLYPALAGRLIGSQFNVMRSCGGDVAVYVF